MRGLLRLFPSGESFPIEGSMVVGSGQTAHLVLDDPAVGREHARFIQQDGAFWVVDLAGFSGTWLLRDEEDPQLVGATPVQMRPGDRVKLGAGQYTVMLLVERE